MEDYQEQEYEFLRRLEEERLDRGKLLKRGLVAGAGLTIFSLSDVALATRTIERVLDVIQWANLNEFKHTNIPR